MSSENKNGTTPQTPEQIEADIALQREELAHTVDELQAKLDVKARATAKASELRDRATTDDGKPKPAVAGGAALAVALVAGLVFLSWRRGHRDS